MSNSKKMSDACAWYNKNLDNRRLIAANTLSGLTNKSASAIYEWIVHENVGLRTIHKMIDTLREAKKAQELIESSVRDDC